MDFTQSYCCCVKKHKGCPEIRKYKLEKMMNINGVIWITGFSAAGKTTLSRKVETLLRKKEISTVSLDGDDLRNILGDHWGYDKTSRQDLAKIYMRLCSHLSSQGHVVIISAEMMTTWP